MIYLCHMARILLFSTKNSWRNFGVKILGWPARATCLVSVPVIQLETGRTFCSRQLCVKIRDKKGVELLLWSEKIKSFLLAVAKLQKSSVFGMENIPEEILQKIFSNLKVVDYIRCSHSCKRFRATCHDKLTWQKILSKLKVCS